MTKKTEFFTDFTGLMIVLIFGSCIAGTIEGINIGKNHSSYNMYNDGNTILSDKNSYFNFEIKEGSRVNIDFSSLHSYEENYTDPVTNETYMVTINDYIPVVLSIMNDGQFDDWILADYPIPSVANSTFYYNQADYRINNLQFPREDDYYFIIYNDSEFNITIEIDIDIIPWGHISATAIITFILFFGLTGFFVKIISTAYCKSKYKKSERNEQEEETRESSDPGRKTKNNDSASKISNKFCQSCGSPLTPKDTRYCPQCGASI